MPFNGVGVFQLDFNWPNDASNGIAITASRVQAEDQNIADGLSMCITTDGQSVTTGNIPFVQGITVTNTVKGDRFWQTNTNIISLQGLGPYGTSSNTQLMAGFGSTLKLTPLFSGRFRCYIGCAVQSVTGTGTGPYQGVVNLRYGTGTAPVQGAAVTGTNIATPDFTIGTSNDTTSFWNRSNVLEITGLVVSTPYWFDFAVRAGANATNVNFLVTYAIIEEL